MARGVSGKLLRDTAEGRRLAQEHEGWRGWGPYVSERQWGTVREDYSADGDAWNDFPFEHASSRAYRWGEDGLAGFGDDELRWCLGLALWNGVDPILKERLFGLTNEQGNHGEDVKEAYYYLDAVPSHAYMRMLYKYPQAAFPYQALLDENRKRGFDDEEYELLDTGVFDEGRYFDVVVDYAKAAPTDILMRVTLTNRGPEAATVHVLPQLWARNVWSWREGTPRPELRAVSDVEVAASHPDCPDMRLHLGASVPLLFCDNDTNVESLYGRPREGFAKDGIEAFVVRGEEGAVNPARTGTKCAAHHRLDIPAGGEAVVRMRFGPAGGRAAPSTASTRCSTIARPRRMSSMPSSRPVSPTPMRGSCSARLSPGSCGPSSSTATTSASGCRGTRRIPRRPRCARAGATPTGATSATATSSRCPTSGSTLGTPPGTSPSRRFRWR